MTSRGVLSPRNRARTGSGAITRIALSWLPAAVRALTAGAPSQLQARSPSTAGSLTGLVRSASTDRAAW